MKSVFQAVLIILILYFPKHGYTREKPGSLCRYEFSHITMGSLFRIICYDRDSSHAAKAAAEATARLDTLNLIMSDYLPFSELNGLTVIAGLGEWVKISAPLFDILRISRKWSEWSEGKFDVTIGPLTRLWRRAGRKEIIPDSGVIDKARELVDYRSILLDPGTQSVRLTRPGMMLDLGGIAKGYAVDDVCRIFQEHGIHDVMVDGAGDIMASGHPPGEKGWKIRLESLAGGAGEFTLKDGAVATSGDLYRFTEFDGIRYSHIVDPSSGYGITIPRTVTVFADNCTEADVLASILSVTGPETGLDRLKNLRHVKAIIYENHDGDIIRNCFGRFRDQ